MTLLEVLSDSPIGATVKAKRANIQSGSYPASFKLRHAFKDLRLVTQTPTRPGQDLKLAAASRGWLERALQAGAGDLDYSAVVATILDPTSSPSGTNGRRKEAS